MAPTPHEYDIAIIGAGIVGLATAHWLQQQQPDCKIIMLDKESGAGLHQTARNSGVVHAGIYYAPGSLKAKLCTLGAAETKKFCSQNGIPFEECGKLIVATSNDELAALSILEERGHANGLNIRAISAAELVELEPLITGKRAILSPNSGIVNYGQICSVLQKNLQKAGVEFRFDQTVTDLVETANQVQIVTTSGDLSAKLVIACAGLHADRIAALSGLADDFRIIPFRGEYFRIADSADISVNHLIYPVPDPSLPFLGVHLTKMIGGFTTVGPNAMFSLGRETYDGNKVHLKDIMHSFSFPGFWKLMMRSLRPGLHELQGSLSKLVYLKRCQKYCPSLTLADLEAHPPGIRAQAVARDGSMIEDFMLRETVRTIHVCNAPSPAATSAFPIGKEIGARVLVKLEN